MAYTENQLKKEWITDDKSWSDGSPITWAKDFGKFLAKKGDTDKDNPNERLSGFSCSLEKLTTSQLRKFFGALKRLQAEGFNPEKKIKLLMLAPQLAYAVGRDKKKDTQTKQMTSQTKIEFFAKEISNAISFVQDSENFKNFINLVEAVVAYHKSEGGE